MDEKPRRITELNGYTYLQEEFPPGQWVGLACQSGVHSFAEMEAYYHLMSSPYAPGKTTRHSPDPPPVSRRERIATAALQGMLANPRCSWQSDQLMPDALLLADALIAELDKETP